MNEVLKELEAERKKITIKMVKAIDNNFKNILDGFIPPVLKTVMKNIEVDFNFSYEDILKYQKMPKYKKAEKKFSNVHQKICSEMTMSEKQFNFIKDVFRPREIVIKNQWKDSIKYLLKARSLMIKGILEHYYVSNLKLVFLLTFFVKFRIIFARSNAFNKEELIRLHHLACLGTQNT